MAKKMEMIDINFQLIDGLRFVSFLAVLYLVENLMNTMEWWFRFLIVSIAVIFLNAFFKGVREDYKSKKK
jgi:hypothetical protein